ALGTYAASGASGYSLGLILGGLLTPIGWRWTFLLPVPLAVAILAALSQLIPSDPPTRGRRRRFDFAGAVTATAAMLLLVHTVVEAADKGWASITTIISLLGAAALVVLFVVIEHRSSAPLVRLGILRSAHIVRANLTAIAIAGSYFAWQFLVTVWLQTILA